MSLPWIPVTDKVDEVLAPHINLLYTIARQSAALAYHANTETLTGNKTLVDTDVILHFLDPGGVSRNVTAPAEAVTNHPFILVNMADAAENLVFKDDGGATIGTVAMGENKMFLSNGVAWKMMTTSNVTGREVLTGTRTYYVRSDGNDANTGLVNNAGGAFLTVQKAIDVAASMIDCKNFDVIIQIADGTYVVNTLTLRNIMGSGSVYIYGNFTTPSNVVLTGGINKSGAGTTYYLRSFAMTKGASSATVAVAAWYGALLYVNGLVFDSGYSYHMDAINGQIRVNGNYSITSGVTQNHWRATQLGSIVCNSMTITITGTPAWGAGFSASFQGSITCYGVTFVGSATGVRYAVSQNGVIFTNGGGAAYFPGDVNGGISSGGQYL